MAKIYLDNAATSVPKPPQVWEAMQQYMLNIGASPGRGGYSLSLDAGRLTLNARIAAARLFRAPSEEHVVFTPNVTYALNCAIHGLLRPEDHVVTTSMEHNSVIRPLCHAKDQNRVEVSIVGCDSLGRLDPDDIRKAIRPNTKMIVMTGASNVVGTILPVADVGRIAAEAGAFFVVDAAQTAGVIDLDFGALGADILAFTGHKALYGPPGTGGMIVSDRAAAEMLPLAQGGTGSKSDEERQPGFLPDKFEPGTPNTVGIAGLAAGMQFVQKTGPDRIRRHEAELASRFVQQAVDIGPKVRVLGPWGSGEASADDAVATVSISFEDGCIDPGRLAYELDAEFGVMVRSGLHCAPLAHKTVGTFPEGTVRFSFGWFNTIADVDRAATALAELASE